MIDATLTDVVHFNVRPGMLDYIMLHGQGTMAFSVDQRIVTIVATNGTFTVTFERESIGFTVPPAAPRS